ncbi:MAG: ABC transporter permease [Bacteroidota bacterium]|nr:ABC transporter permease [Bacteroidota bacterium]
MKTIWIITKKELRGYFDSLMAYILLILFLGFSGFFTWFFGNDIFTTGQASLIVFFQWSYWILFFFIPGITMRTLAEENHSGTIELLTTKSVSNWQIIIAKFLSSWFLVVIALVLTLPYYYSITRLGTVDHGAVLGGYLGLLFISAVYISIGIFASSISNNQVIAFLVTLFIAIFFQWLFGLISSTMIGPLGNILNFLSVNTHFTSMARGVIDSRDIIYFLSLIFSSLIVANFILSKRTLTD